MITRELMGFWLIFARVENVESHYVLATLHQYDVIVNSNVSTWLLVPYLEADVVCMMITPELMELWWIFARLENIEFHHVLATLHQYEWHCQFRCIYSTPSLLCKSWCSAHWDRLGIDSAIAVFCLSRKSQNCRNWLCIQHLANTNGIVNPNVSASPLSSCRDADIVLLSILGNCWTYGWISSASKISKFTMYFQYFTNINGACIAKVCAWILECYFKADVVLFRMHFYSLPLKIFMLCQFSLFPGAECSYAMSTNLFILCHCNYTILHSSSILNLSSILNSS